jgi:hypothetical protein
MAGKTEAETRASAARPVATFSERLEPRWPALLALMAGGCLHAALPPRLSLGPDWALMVIIGLLLISILESHRRGMLIASRNLTFVATGALTLALIASLALLISGLPAHKDAPASLLRSAGVLWITNVLVFSLWYWKVDAGGPLGRARAKRPIRSAFLFPQMVKQPPDTNWSPEFLDYLFVAFNTSTAFSPTDTPILSGWAKILSMLQSLISLTILAILAARAINVL